MAIELNITFPTISQPNNSIWQSDIRIIFAPYRFPSHQRVVIAQSELWGDVLAEERGSEILSAQESRRRFAKDIFVLPSVICDGMWRLETGVHKQGVRDGEMHNIYEPS